MCGSLVGNPVTSFLGQSVVLTELKEKEGEITSHFPSLFSVKATCGIWQLEEGGAAGFLLQLRVKEQSFVVQASP